MKVQSRKTSNSLPLIVTIRSFNFSFKNYKKYKVHISSIKNRFDLKFNFEDMKVGKQCVCARHAPGVIFRLLSLRVCNNLELFIIVVDVVIIDTDIPTDKTAGISVCVCSMSRATDPVSLVSVRLIVQVFYLFVGMRNTLLLGILVWKKN